LGRGGVIWAEGPIEAGGEATCAANIETNVETDVERKRSSSAEGRVSLCPGPPITNRRLPYSLHQ
jgi:hypothetical protein